MIQPRSNRLNLVNSKKSGIFSQSYIIENQKQKDNGTLYVVLEISLKEEISQKISEIILEVLQKEYFKKLNYPSDELTAKNFENALNKTNQALSTLASEGYIDWINRIHAVIAAVKSHKIHFTSTGQAKIFIHRDKNLMNINEEATGAQASPMKTFTNITSGTLLENDRILITTPELLNYLSEKDIKNSIQDHNLDHFIEDYFNNLDTYSSVSAVTINIIDEKNSKPPIKPVTADSINYVKPECSEEKEANLDFPSLNVDEPEGEDEAEEVISADSTKKSKAGALAISGLNKFKNIAGKAGTGFKSLAAKQKSMKESKEQKISANIQNTTRSERIARKNKNIGSLISNFPDTIKSLPKVFLRKFNRLPRSSKILFVSSIILAVLFLGSVIVIKQKKGEINELSQNEILLERALNKEKEASDALIYNDKERAKKLLSEAREEADKLISDGILVAEAQSLLDKIQRELDKAEGITRIDNPIILAEAEGNTDSLIGFGNSVMTYDGNNNFIYELDEENKKLVAISDDSSNVGYFKFGALNDTKNSIIFETDTPSFVEFDLLHKNIEILEVDLLSDSNETQDIAIFGDRLYRLVPEDRQIYKHTRTIAGFSKGLEWVETDNDALLNAKSIAIDGFIYAVISDGSVIKYLRGTRQNFELEYLNKPLESPDSIYTDENLSNLYITEPEQKRILAYNKNNGFLTAQIYSDQFDNIKDIFVNEDEQKLYILNGNDIYGVVLKFEEE